MRCKIRTFETGASRDTEDGKLDYEGALSPIVLERYAEYMRKQRVQKDGSIRTDDNWQKGIPRQSYMKSLLRHVWAVWKYHRGARGINIEDALCGVLFNTMGYLYEVLKTGTNEPKRGTDE